MSALIEHGWVMVQYRGADLAQCYIAVSAGGGGEPNEWQPAYKGWRGNIRVLKVRLPAGVGVGAVLNVWTKINGAVSNVGIARL